MSSVGGPLFLSTAPIATGVALERVSWEALTESREEGDGCEEVERLDRRIRRTGDIQKIAGDEYVDDQAEDAA